jgi:IPT/TIG domain
MGEIRITGTDFTDATKVTIAGKKAEIVETAQTSLKVRVPDDAGPGPWRILVTTPHKDDIILFYDSETGDSDTDDPIAKISKAISDAATMIVDAIRNQLAPAGTAHRKRGARKSALAAAKKTK